VSAEQSQVWPSSSGRDGWERKSGRALGALVIQLEEQQVTDVLHELEASDGTDIDSFAIKLQEPLGYFLARPATLDCYIRCRRAVAMPELVGHISPFRICNSSLVIPLRLSCGWIDHDLCCQKRAPF